MGERFRLYLRLKGITYRTLAEISGISISIISRFCSGGSINSDGLQKILEACPDLNLEWLFFGRGVMIRESGDIVSDHSLLVKNAIGVRAEVAVPETFLKALEEKDKLIVEKDRAIRERDELILSLHRRLLDFPD